MDEYIEYVAACEREKGMLHLQWILDAARLEVGLVEIVPAIDEPIYRTLRRKRGAEGHAYAPPATVPEPPARFLPTGDGQGVLVRDVAP